MASHPVFVGGGGGGRGGRGGNGEPFNLNVFDGNVLAEEIDGMDENSFHRPNAQSSGSEQGEASVLTVY